MTLWELFEFGAYPYVSEEVVLAFVVGQQLIKLAWPRLKLPFADYCGDPRPAGGRLPHHLCQDLGLGGKLRQAQLELVAVSS